MTDIAKFTSRVQEVYMTGSATEHSYRPALETLLSNLHENVVALNEPKRVACGAPDFFVQKSDIIIGHVEAKDLDVGLRDMKGANKNQQERFLKALPNLIYTNCLDWEFYRDGYLVSSVTIAELRRTKFEFYPGHYEALANLLYDFIAQRPQSITSPRELAERMAGKAQLIKDVFRNALKNRGNKNSELVNQYEAFKENLIYGITEDDFADIYAETIAYGMFAARLHDTTFNTFSRRKALDLLPKSNPFLRSLFTYIAGYDLDDRIAWIIDDLSCVFSACDVEKLMAGFGKLTGQSDPFLHFYETFLAAYNPEKRTVRGVWYTPEPVVKFIVRAVDELLQTEFRLTDGLADTSKVTIELDSGQRNPTKKDIFTKYGEYAIEKRDVHRVQILDPAIGTGTFLAEVIKQISLKVRDVAPDMWSQYIEQDLIPRLHGFELLMASYAMCHMKLDMILTELGYKPTKEPPRLSVYLTNSLEEGAPKKQQTFPFAQWLSREAKGARAIKRDMPIMCVIGNPPYSGISQNMGDWISELIDIYKYVKGEHFGEKKHWLHDDYVKFIRLSEYLIEKNGEGILGLITNHGYLDNPTFRGMRWHLMQTFDKIYVLDLHGNTNRKETTPDGQPDENVFDIQQGVAIIVAVKKIEKSEGLATVIRGDLWGSRKSKYKALNEGSIGSYITNKIVCMEPQFAFVRRDYKLAKHYKNGFSLIEFMPTNTSGIVTARDGLVIAFTREELTNRIKRFVEPSKSDEQVRTEFFSYKKLNKYAQGDSRGWKLPEARKSLQNSDWQPDIKPIAYRPFDTRVILYREDMVDWGREKVMKHMLTNKNYALIFSRQAVHDDAPPVNILVSKHIFDNRGVYSNKGISQVAPLYLYPEEQGIKQTRQVNFDHSLYAKLQKLAEHSTHGTPDEVSVFDYIYGVLHCPDYRETYAEFLKSDFPRIPWPATSDEFWDISEKGSQIREMHLMENSVDGKTPYQFLGLGNSVVGKINYNNGKVWINKTQFFTNVPEVSWDFYIGGYRPARKWLQYRKGYTLKFSDVQRYQQILKILIETDRIMQTIPMPFNAIPPPKDNTDVLLNDLEYT